jgi:hypothetical protein
MYKKSILLSTDLPGKIAEIPYSCGIEDNPGIRQGTDKAKNQCPRNS